MNRTKPIYKMFRFNHDLRRRLLEAMERLPHAELTRELRPGEPSPLRLMAHMIRAEIHWVRGVIEEQPLEEPDAWYARFTDLPALRAEAERVEQETRRLLDAIDEEGLRAQRTDPRRSGPVVAAVEEILMHVILHEAHHRGQLTMMLRELGVEPPPTARLTELVRATRVGEF